MLNRVSMLGIIFVMATRAVAQGCPSSAPANSPNYQPGSSYIPHGVPSASISLRLRATASVLPARARSESLKEDLLCSLHLL
jgi:hypothetical protein